MKKAGLLKKILILVVVLALPGFLYYLLMVEGKNHYAPLRILGPKMLAKTSHTVKGKEVPDTIYHTISDFVLNDQRGQKITRETFEKKIFIVDFFYTHCPGVCLQMNKNVSQLVSNYAKSPMVCFLSITVDPKRDSVPVLKKYAESFKPASSRWYFLTGDTATIYNLARKSFLVNAVQNGPDDFTYSDQLLLIDPQGRIRGTYTGASVKDVNKLNDEIKVLISEQLLSSTPEY